MVGRIQEPGSRTHLDQDTLAAIFDRYSRALFRYCLFLCRDVIEADQIVGDVFHQFLEQVHRGLGPKTNLRSYLYQIAYHIIVDHAREREHTVPIEYADYIPEVDSLFSQVEEQILLKELFLVIQNDLTEMQKHVIILRFLEGLSLRESAQVMGIDINAIKSLQKRGILKLQKCLGDRK